MNQGANGHFDSRPVLDLTATDFRRLGYQVVDRLAEFLEILPDLPVAPAAQRAEVASRMPLPPDSPLPDAGTPAPELLAEATGLLTHLTRLNGHPRFWGQIISPGAPAAAFCDLISAVINPNVALWSGAPVAAEMERQAIGWLASLLGCRPDSGGLFVSGGTMANIVGLVTARRNLMSAEEQSSLRVYACESTHMWLEKACILCGVDERMVQRLPMDRQRRMRADVFKQEVERDFAADPGARGVLIATAGEVMMGSVDPLPELIRIARGAGMWVHIDGAYGAPAAAIASDDDDIVAIRDADSVAVDAHKWLYAPLEAGCVLVRNPAHLRQAFDQNPEYADRAREYTEPELDFVRLGPQTSRGFRALKVWFLLRHLGREGYRTCIDRDVGLAKRLYDSLSGVGSIEAVSRNLSITTFRYVPADLDVGNQAAQRYLNELNAKILHKLQRGGRAYLSNAKCEDRYLLRACIINFRTRASDVDTIADIVVEAGDRLDSELRPAALK